MSLGNRDAFRTFSNPRSRAVNRSSPRPRLPCGACRSGASLDSSQTLQHACRGFRAFPPAPGNCGCAVAGRHFKGCGREGQNFPSLPGFPCCPSRRTGAWRLDNVSQIRSHCLSFSSRIRTAVFPPPVQSPVSPKRLFVYAAHQLFRLGKTDSRNLRDHRHLCF